MAPGIMIVDVAAHEDEMHISLTHVYVHVIYDTCLDYLTFNFAGVCTRGRHNGQECLMSTTGA